MGVAGGASKVLLVGLGLGGYIALAFAVAYPELCAGLLLSDVAVDYAQAGSPAGGSSSGNKMLVNRVMAAAVWGFGGEKGPSLAPARLPGMVYILQGPLARGISAVRVLLVDV